MRIGAMISMPGDSTGTAGLIERAKRAEASGFASAWLPQVAGLDALTVLGMAGRETSRIGLGTAVVPTYPRHPTVLAGQALTIQDASGGRLHLGIGLSHKMMIEDSLGLDYSKPIPHTREYLTILNGLLSGERVRFRGDLYRVNAQVTVPGAAKPPVLVAALGPAMLRLCGRLADGTITWMGGLDYLREVAVPTMRASAEAAGRPSPRFVAMVPVILTNDPASGRELANSVFQVYGQLPSYRAALARGGAATPADVAIIGDRSAIRAGVEQFEAVGVTDFVLATAGMDTPQANETFETVAELARARI